MQFHLSIALPILAASVLGQRGPETEPNDSSGQAQVVTLGSQIDAGLTAGEQDWFEFTTSGSNVTMFTHGAIAVDTVLELFDATGANRLAVNDDSDAYFSSISLDLAAGTYQLRVTGWAPTTAGPYALEFAEIATVGATGSEIEPNDSAAQADAIAGGDVLEASLGSGTDEDWYRITLTAPRTGVWFEIGEGTAPWVSNHRYEIRDSTGVLLAPTSMFGSNGGNSSPSEIRTNEVRCWPAGTYYLVVKNSTLPIGYGGLVPQGNYRVRLLTMPMGSGPVGETEPNNTIATANPIAYGGSVTGSITDSLGADPSDVFGPFVITGPTVLQFQTTQGSTGALLDSTIRLLDVDGMPLQSWTVGNTLTSTSHARATVSFTAAETYYIEVLSPGAAPSQAGSYAFEIGASPPLHVRASYDRAEVNGQCLGSNSLRPTLAVDSPGERPVLGGTLSRSVKFLPAFSPFFLVEGFSDEFALGTIALPYDLGLLGAPDCYVHVSPLANLLYVGNAVGEVRLDSRMPTSIVFRGAPIYEQAVVLDLPANSLGITSSNYARKLLGDR